ncbi:hypothetical protein H4R24_000532 [Coemansia sp. RSA 988]|nr:hypothetical protein H4R24_000532 [Coemansia sp. RSA 988]
MKTVFSFGSALALFASMASMANAHTYLSKLTLDGVQESEGKCIRPYPSNRDFPVKDPSSTDLTCGTGGVSTTASETCPVEAGSTITVEWHHDNDSASDDIIDGTHLGPCLVYMAPLESNGSGNVWFKIFEDGYDASTSTWCVDKIRSSGGKLDVTLPSDIKAGDYLLRTEVIALHESDTDYSVNPDRGAQYYPNCAQLSVTGGGSAEPEGSAIPGIYKTDSPGILFNLYNSFTSYPIPGPDVYVSGSGNNPGKDNDKTVEDSSAASEEETDNSTSANEEESPAEPSASEEDTAGEPSISGEDTAAESTDSAEEDTTGKPSVSDEDTAAEPTESMEEDSTAEPTDTAEKDTAAEPSASEEDTAFEPTNSEEEESTNQSTPVEDTGNDTGVEDYTTSSDEAPTSSAPEATATGVPGKCH